MKPSKLLFVLSISTFALAACAPQQARIASTGEAPPAWAFETSDVPLEPGWRFGTLANGMRYVIRPNATPKGTALVRMQVKAGSIDENDGERGYAHFVEHMAFNGSAKVPEGEMIKLLEREGLAFGADTNASTGYQYTTYTLDLPRGDVKLLDTALMLMRETAGELTFSAAAVERERGVVMSEMRDRNTFGLKALVDNIEFVLPGSRVSQRLPIGTQASLEGASAEGLKAFWSREYVPGHVTLFVIGDFDPDVVEANIKARFGDWRAAPVQAQPKAGPIDPKYKAKTDIYIDPALAERVTITRNGKWIEEPDTLAMREENVLRQIGYAIINRRLLRLARQPNPPFRAAGYGTDALFREARETELRIDTVDGQWRPGLIAAGTEYRRALTYGFTPEEVAEQVAILRGDFRKAADGRSTRSHNQLFGAALDLVNDGVVPLAPDDAARRFEGFVPAITPVAVLTAMKREAVPLNDPLIRFQGRTPPLDGEAGLRTAWGEAQRTAISPPERRAAASFGYSDFGPAGKVLSDVRDPVLGIRQIRFANGVMLNIKRTDLDKDRVLVQVSIDGGNLLNTRDNPLATRMFGVLNLGGLGKHSKDELDSLLAGRTVSASFSPDDETFVARAQTTPQDLELEFQYLAAQVSDPGYRPEGEVLFRQSINNFFAALRATPGAALGADLGGILSDNDPRYSLGAVDDWRKLDFARLKADVGDRLANGAIEIGVVGDVDEEAVVAAVSRTFGALPQRETAFRAYAENRDHPFTANRAPRVLRHTGAKDQALLTISWPTRDGEDPVADISLALLQRVVQIEMTEELRERLGKTYGPGAASNTSRTWRGYGTFLVSASVDVKDVPATRSAIAGTIGRLIAEPVSADVLQRARAPLLESFDNMLKTNGGWLVLVDRAQTQPDRIERYMKARARIEAITTKDLQLLARQYLRPNLGVEVLVLPEGVEPPAAK